jgi:hypothetical protein
MSEKLVTVAAFSLAIEADLARTKLESEGIECFVADEHTVTMNWLYSHAIGGVKLKVWQSDLQRAKEILGRRSATEEGQGDHVAGTEELHCPRCGSADVHYERFSRRLAFASWILLSFPLPLLKKKWNCRTCGHQWKHDGNPYSR